MSLRGDHRVRLVRGQRAGKHAHGAQRLHAHKKILHESGGAQVQDVEALDGVQFYFQVVQAEDGAGFFGQVARRRC